MKNDEARVVIGKLKRRIEFCEKNKKKLIDYVQKLKDRFLDREINYREYEHIVNEERDGKTISEWLEYYDNYIEDCEKRIKEQEKEIRKSSVKRVLFFVLVPFVLLGIILVLIYVSKEIVLLAPPTIEVYTQNLNLIFDSSQDYIWNVGNPGELQSVKISGLIEGGGSVRVYLEDRLILDSSNLEVTNSIITGLAVGEFNDSLGNESVNESVIVGGNKTESNMTLPGENVTSGENATGENITEIPEENVTLPKEILIKEFTDYCEESCDLAGFGLNETNYTLRIEISGNTKLELDSVTYGVIVEVLKITKREEKDKKGKKVIAFIPRGLENTPIVSQIPKEWKIERKESIKLHWKEGNKDVEFNARDLDNDGLIDEIEWLAPASGNQTFDIIVITKAYHLDENRTFVSDIYNEIKTLDDIWTEVIPNRDYVRAVFEKNLTSERDISIYLRIINGNPRIEVYEQDGIELIAEKSNLEDNNYNNIFLVGLEGEQDTFDLKVVGGSIEIDHIIDPVQEYFEDCSDLSDWVLQSPWKAGTTGQDSGWCVASNTGGIEASMTSSAIDLSGQDLANLTFTRSTKRLGAGEYLRIYANSSVNAWTLIVEFGDNANGNYEYALEDFITLPDDSVHLRAGCLNNKNNEKCRLDNINITSYAAPDNEYPIFSNYWDDNATMVGSGIAHFNVSVDSTNGTVFLEIDGSNYSASNTTASDFNVSVSLLAETYAYYWGSWGNGTNENYNTSGLRYYTVNISYGTLDVNITFPPNDYNVNQNESFQINATVTCQGLAGATCGTVYAFPRYNDTTATPDSIINETGGATPFYIVGGMEENPPYYFDGWNFSVADREEFSSGLTGNDTYFWISGNDPGGINAESKVLRYLANGTYDNWNFSTAAQDTYIYDVHFDGTYFFVLLASQNTDAGIYRYTSEGVYDNWNFSIENEVSVPSGLYYDETYFWVMDGLYENGTVLRYLANGTYDNWNFSVKDELSNARDIYFDGMYFWVSGYSPRRVFKYTSDGIYTGVNFSTNVGGENFPGKIHFDGTYFYIQGAENDQIFRYAPNDSSSKTLEQGGQWNVTLVINATGLGSYEIDILFNSSYGNANVPENDTDDATVIISGEVINQPPKITFVSSILNVDPEPKTTANVTFNFTVYDIDGPSDILVAAANFTFSGSGEAVRQNSSCAETITFGDYANYSCTIQMWYWDADGDWNIAVYVEDSSGQGAINDSTSFIYNLLKDIEISLESVIFDIVTGATNQNASSGVVIINNTGNAERKLSVNGTDLYGEDFPNAFLGAGNFTVRNKTGGDPPAECFGTPLVNGQDVEIFDSFLYRGNLSEGNGMGQSELYFCIPEVPSNLPTQIYSTSQAGAWTIKILAIAIALGGNRRRKKKRELKNDKLVKVLGLLTDELKEKYSKVKSEAIKIIIKELGRKYSLSAGKVIETLELKKKEDIPVVIFSKELGGLEALCKYLKENLGMRYHEIAKEISRDDRTIWNSYNKAREKDREPIEVSEDSILVPFEIFQDRKLTVLESIIKYLRGKGMKFIEIGKLLERDQRNIQTIYSRAVKKIGRKI